MVKINSRIIRERTNAKTGAAVFMGLAVMTVLYMLSAGGEADDVVIGRLDKLQGAPQATSIDIAANSQKIKQWRKQIKDQCTAATSAEAVLQIANINKVGLTSGATAQQPRGDAAVNKCKHVVMDFGANIGDTSGHVVDAGLVVCDRSKDLKAKTPFPHFDVSTKEFVDAKNRNPLTHNLIKLMSQFGALTGPEDYCYYGVEGNPVFTERLQGIEDHVMALQPRPIQHMHFFTESVGAGVDGPTKLYLDTINTKQNFWGSSIFRDHQDVRKSASQANTTADTIAADVMGYTIGTLMRKTLVALDPNADPADRKGNHLVLKVDIEGGEYPLLHQAVEEGTLCQFVQMGNTADLFIEFHSARVTGRHDYVGKTKTMKERLSSCGVTFRNLAAWWA